MDHLTVDQIIEFVSMDELNERTAALSVSVNGHIRRCGQCRRTVRAFQMIHDEFSRSENTGDFAAYIQEIAAVPELEAQELVNELHVDG